MKEVKTNDGCQGGSRQGARPYGVVPARLKRRARPEVPTIAVPLWKRWVWRILANTTTHSLPVETDEDWLILAEQIGMRKAGAFDEISSVDDCKDFIGCLLEIGLLTRDGKGRIESARMQKNALYFGMQRANGAKGGRPRKNKSEPMK